jgi:hypothetical protein
MHYLQVFTLFYYIKYSALLKEYRMVFRAGSQVHGSCYPAWKTIW